MGFLPSKGFQSKGNAVLLVLVEIETIEPNCTKCWANNHLV